jgi:hypothetical protein
MLRSSSQICTAFVASLLLVLPACRRDEVTFARVPKGTELAGASAEGPTASGAPAPAPTGKSTLRWKLPEGWTEAESSGMRFATLKAPVNGKLDISVTMLVGTAGGELANVNRWRGQIGLSPVEESQLGPSRKVVKTPAGEVALFDFVGEGEKKSRMLAGCLSSPDGNSWFLKMVGDDAAVGAARANFMRLLETLRFD